MANRTRVYVSGPISLGDQAANVRHGIETGIRLLNAGYAPFIPHLSHLAEPASTVGTPRYEWWLENDFAWIAVSDAILRLPGESKGADAEVEVATALGIPVYTSLEEILTHPPCKGDPRFHALLRRLGQLHDRKQADYGRAEDPFSNVRASQEWGVEPWIGALIRLNDKVHRLQQFAKRRMLINEGAEDSLQDIAVYALIALILLRETDRAC